MTRRLAAALLIAAAAPLATAQPVGTAFTYQGRLTDAGTPPSGAYDLEFVLMDAATGGAQVGPLQNRDDVVVANGLFTVSLDFGAVFAGSKRFVEIRVRPGASSGAYTTLAGRQELTPAPNASFASSVPWAGIANKPAGFADDVDDDSGGDITDVVPGTGLNGGGSSGSVTLGVSLGGNGSSTSVARADHVHSGEVWTAAFPTTAALTVANTATGGFTDGIWGQSDATSNGRGVVGYATSTASGIQTYGVWGQTDAPSGRGVYGFASNASAGAVGVYGQTQAPFGYGVRGESFGNAVGVAGSSGNNLGVWGNTQGPNSGTGVLGDSSGSFGSGVRGRAFSTVGTTYSIHGEAPASPNGYAGYFAGRGHFTGTLSKGGGAFKIDHPLDPENKYLYHSFVESPDMKNVYDGVVTTDANGDATVELPEWFEALNRDFRYQLTVIGRFAQAIVAREVEKNAFAIRTSLPNVKVSWQVTGIRKDPFAEKNRIRVEEDKPADERGTLLHPDAWNQPPEKGLDFVRRQSSPQTP